MNEHKSKVEETLRVLGPMSLTPFMVWAVIHSIRSRTLEDFIRYSSFVAAPIAVIGLFALLVAWKNDGFRRPSWEEALIVLLSPLMIALMGVVYYAMGAALKDAYLWLRTPSSTNSVAGLTTALATLLVGLALFYFRLHLRSPYGLTEILIGLAVATQRAAVAGEGGREDAAFYLAVLTAGVYLVVRGLDNVHQGITRTPTDPIVKALFDYFKEMSARATAGQSPEELQSGNP